MRTNLSPKENLIRTIHRADPEYVPVRRMNGLIPGMARRYYNGSMLFGDGEDRWGVRWAGGRPAGQEWEPRIQAYVVEHPLKDLSTLSSFRFPDPESPELFEGLFDGVNHSENLVMGEVPYLLFERAHLLMGMQALLMAMVDTPEAAALLLHRIADHQIALIRRFIAHGVDAIRATDDYGAQNALLISPRLWRKLIKPELARIVGVVKDAGLLFFLHSCGHIMEIVPDLLAMGVDVLDPIQAQSNDHARLKQLYGDKLTFLNGVSTQEALSQGTPREVEAEVRERIRVLAPGGGYILGPDNAVHIPEANYEAYLRAGEQYGRYPLRF